MRPVQTLFIVAAVAGCTLIATRPANAGWACTLREWIPANANEEESFLGSAAAAATIVPYGSTGSHLVTQATAGNASSGFDNATAQLNGEFHVIWEWQGGGGTPYVTHLRVITTLYVVAARTPTAGTVYAHSYDGAHDEWRTLVDSGEITHNLSSIRDSVGIGGVLLEDTYPFSRAECFVNADLGEPDTSVAAQGWFLINSSIEYDT